MNYRLLLLAFLLSIAPAVQAQPSDLPTLRRQLTASTSDTARLRLLLRLTTTALNTQPDSAWPYANRARSLARTLADRPAQLKVYGQLGILHGIRGNDESSLRLFLAQLRLTGQDTSLVRFRPGILSNIAHSYFSLGRLDQARAMLERARRLDEQAHDTSGVLSDMGNLAEIQMTQDQPDQALRTVTQALALRRRYHAPTPTHTLDVQLVSVLLRQGQYQAARDTALAVLPRMLRQQHPDELAYMHNCLLKAYRGLNQPILAQQAGQQALYFARLADQRPLRQEVLENLAGLAATRRDFARAYALRLQADSLSRQLTAASNAKTVQDLQFRYDTERREARIRELARESADRRRQNWLWAGLALVGVAAAAFLYRNLRLQGKVFRQREQLLEERRRQSEARQLLEEAARAALQLELDSNQRELATATVFAQQKTQLLEDLTGRLESLARRVPEHQREPVADMKRAIRQHLQVGDDWERVTLHFEKIHPQFFEQLREQHPALTPNDLKQCAYLKLNLTNKDIANLLNIEPNSVKIAHYRIKKKLALAEDHNLRDFILSV